MSTPGNKVGEQVPNVEMARLLESYGLPAPALVLFDGLIPDLYMNWRGVRIVIELKEEAYEKQLRLQVEKRLMQRVCDLAVGITYPEDLVMGALGPPTPMEVGRRLMSSEMKILAMVSAAKGAKEVAHLTRFHMNELPGLLTRYTSETMPESELKEAIQRVGEGVDSFVSRISAIPEKDTIASRIREVLEGV